MISFWRTVFWATTIVLLAAVLLQGTNPGSTKPGDADGSGDVNARDVYSIRRVLMNSRLSVHNLASADCNQNGRLDQDDAVALQEHLDGTSLAVRTSLRSGRERDFQIGDVIQIQALEHFFPFEVTEGKVRIQSIASAYDSGVHAMTHVREGRSMSFHWPTQSLHPAADFRIDVTIRNKSGETKNRSIQLALASAVRQPDVLCSATDLFLPFWDIGLHASRVCNHHSKLPPIAGMFGYGWRHAFSPELKEYTDGSVSVVWADHALPTHYLRASPGKYRAFLDYGRDLTRDKDGSFQIRTCGGLAWRFRPDLLLDYVGNRQGKRVHCRYDSLKRLVGLQDSAGQQIRFHYDKNGNVIQASDSTSRIVKYAYNSAGELATVTGPAPYATQYEYDEEHRLTAVTFADGRRRFYSYDDESRLASTSLADGVDLLRFEYMGDDIEPSIMIITDALGRSHQEHTRLDSLVQEIRTGEASAKLEYDARQRLVAVMEPDGATWKTTIGSEDLSVRFTDPEGSLLAGTYSPDQDRLTSFTHARGVTTRLEYLRNGEPTKVFHSDGTHEVNFLQPARDGSLVVDHLCRNGQSNRYFYDPRGLLVKKVLYVGRASRYSYDQRGNLISASNGSGTIEFGYDIASRLTRVTYPGSRTFEYVYDACGRRTRMTGPSGAILDYKYDSAGRLSAIADANSAKLAAYEYNAASEMVGRTLQNGVQSKFSYDFAGRLARIAHQDQAGETVASWTYQYDATGKLVECVSPDSHQEVTYDRCGRPIKVTAADASVETISYDKGGNRTQVTDGAGSRSVITNLLDQYTTIGDTAYTYDLNGNLNSKTTSGGKTTYEYEGEGRLIRARLPDGRTIKFTYDPLGRLITTTDAKGLTWYLWDGNQLALQEDQNHKPLARYVWNPQAREPLLFEKDADRFAFLQDGLGNVTDLLHSDGKLAEHYRYGFFGDVLAGGSLANPLRYRAAIHQPDLQLTLSDGRWRCPVQSRSITAMPGGTTRFAQLHGRCLIQLAGLPSPGDQLLPAQSVIAAAGINSNDSVYSPGLPNTARRLGSPWHGESRSLVKLLIDGTFKDFPVRHYEWEDGE